MMVAKRRGRPRARGDQGSRGERGVRAWVKMCFEERREKQAKGMRIKVMDREVSDG